MAKCVSALRFFMRSHSPLVSTNLHVLLCRVGMLTGMLCTVCMCVCVCVCVCKCVCVCVFVFVCE